MAHPACRQRVSALASRPTFDNPGLALARYLPQNGDDHASAKDLLQRVQTSSASEVYKAAFQRYKAALPNPVRIELTLGGPMALGLGMSSPLEVGLTTLHTYGMPYIPGSAVKGVCRDVAEALARLRPDEEGHVSAKQFLDLIGDQKNAGLCVFHDAWYDPSSVGGKPFHRDVVTVHHPFYYQQKNNAWPTDFDDPKPVPFIVVRPGAKFLFAVKPPSPEWADFVKDLLVHAMTTHGVGGKTNAGYGWFEGPNGGIVDGGPGGITPPSSLVWTDVTLTLNPGTGEVSCMNPKGPGKATCKSSDLPLTDEQTNQLKQKKKSLAGVVVTVVLIGGNNYRITGLTTP